MCLFGSPRVSGPAWLDTERYDIVAKAAAAAGSDLHPLRLRALLTGRFKLAVHRETREAPVYALVVARNGPKIKKEQPVDAGDGDMESSRGHVTAKAVSLLEAREANPAPLNRLLRASGPG